MVRRLLFLVTGETERNIDLILQPKSQNIDRIFRQKSTRFFAQKPTRFLDTFQPDFFDKNHLRSIIKRCGQHSPIDLGATRSCSVLWSTALRRMATSCEVEVINARTGFSSSSALIIRRDYMRSGYTFRYLSHRCLTYPATRGCTPPSSD